MNPTDDSTAQMQRLANDSQETVRMEAKAGKVTAMGNGLITDDGDGQDS